MQSGSHTLAPAIGRSCCNKNSKDCLLSIDGVGAIALNPEGSPGSLQKETLPDRSRFARERLKALSEWYLSHQFGLWPGLQPHS